VSKEQFSNVKTLYWAYSEIKPNKKNGSHKIVRKVRMDGMNHDDSYQEEALKKKREGRRWSYVSLEELD